MEAMFFSSVWVVLLIVVGADAQTNSIKDYCKRCVLDVQQCNCSIRYDHLNITCNDDGQDFPKLFNDSQDTCKNFDGLDNATVSIYIACPISKIPARCLNLNGEKLRRFSLFITSEWNLQNIDSSAFAEIKGSYSVVAWH